MAYINSYKNQNWLIPQSIKEMIPKEQICTSSFKKLQCSAWSHGQRKFDDRMQM